MRLIFLDTETTGLSPVDGHRLVEIACVEMLDGQLTGREFHHLLNPGRMIPPEISDIHGIGNEMVRHQPRFREIAGALIDFVADGNLVMHHAPFDTAFLAAEFREAGSEFLPLTQPDKIIDTLPHFRRRYPGSRCTLSALCERHGVMLQGEEVWHGALADACMLARLWQACAIADGAAIGWLAI